MSSVTNSFFDISKAFVSEYRKSTVRVKILDAFIIYGIFTTFIQLLYMALVGSFPFNSFLAGVFSSIGFVVLTVCLRLQIDPTNKDFINISPERAFADYVLAVFVLHFVVWNYIG